jgi:hypothetical protein
MDNLSVRQVDHSSTGFDHHSNAILECDIVLGKEIQQTSFLHQFEHLFVSVSFNFLRSSPEKKKTNKRAYHELFFINFEETKKLNNMRVIYISGRKGSINLARKDEIKKKKD